MSQGHEEARQILWTYFDKGYQVLKDFFKKSNVDGNNNGSNSDNAKNQKEDENFILDPPMVKPKGISNSRLKGHFNKQRKRLSIVEKEGTSKSKLS